MNIRHSLGTSIILAGSVTWAVAANAAPAPWPSEQTRQSQAPSARGPDALAGVWVWNQDKSDRPGSGSRADGDGGRRGGGRDGGGGRSGGRRSGGGIGGLGGGRGGGARDAERDPAQAQAEVNYLRSLAAASSRMTIVVHEKSVVITEADGARATIQTDNKKVDDRAENGLVKLTRKAHWDGATLVSEIDIDDGPKIERRYELSEGGTELRTSTKISGGRGGRETKPFVQVYERPDE